MKILKKLKRKMVTVRMKEIDDEGNSPAYYGRLVDVDVKGLTLVDEGTYHWINFDEILEVLEGNYLTTINVEVPK